MSNVNQNEIYFQWWLDEAKKYGLVLDYKREPKTFELIPAISVNYAKHYKKKESIWKSHNLTNVLSYTPDYCVKFSFEAINKLIALIDTKNNVLVDYSNDQPGSGMFDNVYQETLFFYAISEFVPRQFYDSLKDDAFHRSNGGIEIWFDVKPPSKAIRFSGQLGSSRDFRYIQPLIYMNHKIYVNKVVPIDLYAKTFMPERYRYTDKDMSPRLIKKPFKNIEEWFTLKGITNLKKQ